VTYVVVDKYGILYYSARVTCSPHMDKYPQYEWLFFILYM